MPKPKTQTLLKTVKNIGPVTLAEFMSMGIETLEQMEKIGFEDFCRKYVESYPERLNANAFLGILCTLEKTVWTQATQTQRAKAHALTQILRAEYGLPKKITRKIR